MTRTTGTAKIQMLSPVSIQQLEENKEIIAVYQVSRLGHKTAKKKIRNKNCFDDDAD